jgi:integrase
MRRYHDFNHRKDPALFGAERVTAFLSQLATELDVRASTQNQALSALLFLYREVLHVELPWLDDLVRAKRPHRLPVVLSRDEVRAVIAQLEGAPRWMGMLLYGAGLRLMECCRLRVKDLDFDRNKLIVREGKGDKDRVALLPASLHSGLKAHLAVVRAQHEADVRKGAGWVELPHALGRKLPGEGRTWPWDRSLGLEAARRPLCPRLAATARPLERQAPSARAPSFAFAGPSQLSVLAKGFVTRESRRRTSGNSRTSSPYNRQTMESIRSTPRGWIAPVWRSRPEPESEKYDATSARI